jgi:MFS family permease
MSSSPRSANAERRGSQIGWVQALAAIAALAGPGLGGLLLTTFGPAAAFGTAFLVGLAGILPLLRIDEPRLERAMPEGAYAAAANAVRLYFADGWIQVSLTTAWSIVMFQALGGRYDSFGGTLSLAALAGAVGGLVLGRVIVPAALGGELKAQHARRDFRLVVTAVAGGPRCGSMPPFWRRASCCAASLSAMPPPWSRSPSAPRC